MKGLACFGLAVVAIVVSSLMNGWALTVLWGWFVVPLFNLPPLSIAYAIGIALIVGLLRYQGDDNKSDAKEKEWSDLFATLIVKAVLSPVLTVLIGWIVKAFI